MKSVWVSFQHLSILGTNKLHQLSKDGKSLRQTPEGEKEASWLRQVARCRLLKSELPEENCNKYKSQWCCKKKFSAVFHWQKVNLTSQNFQLA